MKSLEIVNPNYPSRFEIGELVKLEVAVDTFVDGYVRCIIFSNMKIRYSIYIKSLETTFHNIDSCFVHNHEKIEFVDFGEDNYS